jgi:hypothetical protein
MTDTDKKLEAIEEKLTIQLKKSRFSLWITSLIYIIILLFVIVYTAYTTITFKELATPKTVAELLIMKTEQVIPNINKYLTQNTNSLADKFAIQTVDYARTLIPSVGLVVQGQLDVTVKQINDDFNRKYLPTINEYLKENKTDIISNINTLSDEEAAKTLAKEIMKQVDPGILDISNEFNAKMIKFKKEINHLAYSPNSKLTKKELAHKRAIIYWKYLVEHSKSNQINL